VIKIAIAFLFFHEITKFEKNKKKDASIPLHFFVFAV